MSRRRITAALGAAAVTVILATGGASGRAGGPPGRQPPVDQTPPTISGSAMAANTLTASTGTWQGKSLKFAYQWLRCDSAGRNCGAISGATGSAKTLSTADVGSTLRVIVTASNRNGSTAATSLQTAAVAPATTPLPPSQPPTTTSVAPAESSLPVVTGTAQQNQNLTTSTGSWSGTTPMTYSYQWQRCDSGGGSCAPISGATGPSYGLGSADVGSTIRASVTATNSGGSATASSAATGVVTSSPPASTMPSEILFDGSFSRCPVEVLTTSNCAPWDFIDDPDRSSPNPPQIVNDPLGSGQHVLDLTADLSDTSSTCCGSVQRVDLAKNPISSTAHEGLEIWKVEEFDFPKNATGGLPPYQPTCGEWNEIDQWHTATLPVVGYQEFELTLQTDSSCANPHFLGIVEGGDLAHGTPGYTTWKSSMNVQYDHWYKLVQHIIWSCDPTKGLNETWIDGVKLASVQRATLYCNSSTGVTDTPTAHLSNYHRQASFANTILFRDYKIGTTSASIGFVP
jgi:hypothetical protein